MAPYFGEFIGTFLLILMGVSVNANLSLSKTKGYNGGWILMPAGWGISVVLGVYSSNHFGGSGHINPAVSVSLSLYGQLDPGLLPGYIAAQMAGAFCGAITAWAAFIKHFEATDDASKKLGVFSTSPAIPHNFSNFISECIGTFVLVFGVLTLSGPTASNGALDALPVALLVTGIGMGLGGPTGYAINPARDLGPRIAHFILPIPGKGSSDWTYSWIPVLAPITGGLLASGFYHLIIG